MIKKLDRNKLREKKHRSIRRKIVGTAERPRLSVYRSLKNIFVQIIDDSTGTTLVSASTIEKGAKAQINNQKMSYLYSTGEAYVFMDNATYEQIEVPEAQLEYELNFLKENMEVSILMFGDEILGIDLPTTVELTVTETEPGVKGDTAQGATKAATVETGYTLQVPLFVKEGDVLVINTAEGSYVSRA